MNLRSNNMNCLVTGATGFIGTALINRLVENNETVIALVHHKSITHHIDTVNYVSGDITDKKITDVITRNIDVVFHCAALVKDYGPKKQFYEINVQGTKNLVSSCKKHGIKRFIFLSHIQQQPKPSMTNYSKTKLLAEKYLIDECRNNGFPIIIIRPGNVYGPGATTWVLRPVDSIKKDRIALIDHGSGIFHHTYIDNLIDALIKAMQKDDIIGETFNITDGDETVSWGDYLNDLSHMVANRPISKNLSKPVALFIGYLMMGLYYVFRIKPWVSPGSVRFFTNKTHVSIGKAEKLLEYQPRIDYQEGIKRTKQWLQNKNFI